MIGFGMISASIGLALFVGGCYLYSQYKKRIKPYLGEDIDDRDNL